MSVLTEQEACHRSRASQIEHIKNLNCWGSDLCDIKIVRKMINLEVLNLSANNIMTLEDVAYCPKLKEIYLRRNKVQSLNELKYLRNLPQLTVLWLADNPCSDNEKYREIVLQNLPNLRKLDSKEVCSEERLNIANQNSITFFNDFTLPDYTGLDLNHTLTIREINEATLRNSPVNKNKLPTLTKIAMIEEKLPEVSSSVDIDHVNKKRLELGLKKLDIGLPSGNKPTSALNTKSVADSVSLPNTSNNIKNGPNNTIQAIKLLLNDLSLDELNDILHHVKDLKVEKEFIFLNNTEQKLALFE